jgi:hypothetical protein
MALVNNALFTLFTNNATHAAMFTTSVHIAPTGCFLETGITGFTGFEGSNGGDGCFAPNLEFKTVPELLICQFCSK